MGADQSRMDLGAARGAAGAHGTPLAVAAAICLAFALILLTATDLFNDGDTSWHLAAGRWILDNFAVPKTDPFSSTYFGQPWVAHEWLAEVAMAVSFVIGGWSGLAILTAVAVSLLLFMVALEARRWMRSLALTLVLVGVFLVLAPFTLARPHVLAWPLLAAWTLLLIRARERGRPPPWSAALLMLLWANLHASFLFGLLLIGPFALEALIDEKNKKAVILGWGRFGFLSLGLSLLTPHGIHGLLYPVEVSSMTALPLIQEWRATIPAEMHNFQLALLATLFMLLWKGVKVPPVRLFLLLGLLFLAFAHVRHQAVFVIVAALLLPGVFGRSAGRQAALNKSASPLVHGVLAAILLAGIAVRLAVPMPQPDSKSNPLAAIAKVPVNLRHRAVFNSYGFGGPLIRSGIRPYIDGRGDMYGDAFMFEYDRARKGDITLFRRLVDRWNIGWTILAPEEGLVPYLDKEAGWRRIHADRWAVIHIKAGR